MRAALHWYLHMFRVEMQYLQRILETFRAQVNFFSLCNFCPSSPN